MRRRKSLYTLQRLAEHAADATSREVGHHLRALREEEQRLKQLAGYLTDYQRLSAKGAPGLTMGAIRSRRGFVQRLNEAISRQQQVVRDHEDRYHQQIDRWRTARSRALGLERFNERLQEQERDRQDRRDQARLDEISRNQRLR